jgi:hypothetical protein
MLVRDNDSESYEMAVGEAIQIRLADESITMISPL